MLIATDIWYRPLAWFDSVPECLEKTALTFEEILHAVDTDEVVHGLHLLPTIGFVAWLQEIEDGFGYRIHDPIMEQLEVAEVTGESRDYVNKAITKFRRLFVEHTGIRPQKGAWAA